MPDWWEHLIQKPWMQLPVGQVLFYTGAGITAIIALYKRFPAIKTGAINAWIFVNIVPTVRRIDQTLERVRAQVENSHTTNLRDELDQDREETRRRHEELMATLRGMKRDIGRLDQKDIERGKDIRHLTQKLDEHVDWSRNIDRSYESRLGDLEDTLGGES